MKSNNTLTPQYHPSLRRLGTGPYPHRSGSQLLATGRKRLHLCAARRARFGPRYLFFRKKEAWCTARTARRLAFFVTGGMDFTTRGSGNVEFVSKNPLQNHPLFNASVDLPDNCIFSSENSTIIYNGFGVMNPFILSIEGKGMSFRRRFCTNQPNRRTT